MEFCLFLSHVQKLTLTNEECKVRESRDEKEIANVAQERSRNSTKTASGCNCIIKVKTVHDHVPLRRRK